MRIFLRLWLLLCLSGAAWAMDDVLVPEEGPSIAERSILMPGFMPLYWDADEGRLYGDIEDLTARLFITTACRTVLALTIWG